MRLKKSHMFWLSLAIALFGTALWIMRTRADPAPERSSGAAIGSAVGLAAVQDSAAHKASSLSAVVADTAEVPKTASRAEKPTYLALPPYSTPLAEQVDLLLQLAESGDPAASCRLVVGLIRCTEEQRSDKFTRAMMRSLEEKHGKNDDKLIALVARHQEKQAKQGLFCDGIDAESLPQPDDLIRKSLYALSPRQKTILALTRSDGTLRRLRGRTSFSESNQYVLPQALADHSVEFLMAGYQAHDPLALEGLVMLHAPNMALGPQSAGVWLPNPRLFLQYSGLLLELYGSDAVDRSAFEAIRVTAASVTPEERQRIQERVVAEADRWRRSENFRKHQPSSQESEENATESLSCAE